MSSVSPRRDWLGLALRLTLTAVVFALLFSRIDLSAVVDSMARVPPEAAVAAGVAYVVAMGTGIVRWRVLLATYGVARMPPWGFLCRWYLIAMFYNLLPGGVGGDVLRGLATREHFEDRSNTRAIGVVFVERALGLGGLLLLSGVATLLSPAFDPHVLWAIAIGLVGVTAGITGVALGPRVSRFLPGRLGDVARSLPRLVHPGGFVGALAVSLLSHLMLSFAGYLMIRGLTDRVSLGQAFVVFPLGMLASAFPLTIAGAGTREATIVLLFARIGVDRSDALVTSLFLLLCQLVMSALGGALQGRQPLFATASSPER